MSLFLIDLGEPVLFCHVPKTGGTSVRQGRQLSTFRVFEPDDDWRQYPSFAVVRDPFDRLESCWRDFRFLRPRTALGFVTFVNAMNRPDIEGNRADPRTMEHHAAPMTHPVHGLSHATFIGRTERLQRDFDHFCVSHGLPTRELPHHRKANGAPRAPRTRAARQLVERYYEEDYEMMEALS
jgi:hypothetical protein